MYIIISLSICTDVNAIGDCRITKLAISGRLET